MAITAFVSYVIS